jgi:hypothetical protein
MIPFDEAVHYAMCLSMCNVRARVCDNDKLHVNYHVWEQIDRDIKQPICNLIWNQVSDHV